MTDTGDYITCLVKILLFFVHLHRSPNLLVCLRS